MSTDKAKKLSPKEELFVAAYLANGGNATQAAIAAGYSKRSAYAKGSEIAKRPHVAAAIQAARRRITTKFKVNAERVVEEMAVIGFSDIRNYRLTLDGHVELVPSAPDSAMRAVKRIKRKLRLVPQAKSQANPTGAPATEVETEFELWNKDGELRNLGEYLAMFKENRAVDDDEQPDEELTVAQRKERVLQLLREAARRRRAAKPNRSKRSA